MKPSLRHRRWDEWAFLALALATVLLAFAVLVALVTDLLVAGGDRLSWQFLTSYPSRIAARAGVYAALVGSVLLVLLTALLALPLGVGTALYLEEYAPRNRLTRLIELNIANLAGVPSIIFGILGLQLFVRTFGLGRSLLAGALTMALLIVPVIVIAAREAIRSVPASLREASLALGATRWQTIRRQVLPLALPGIMTGSILALSRAIGETAPLITMGALTYVAFVPDGLMSPFAALPIQAFNWLSRPQPAFHENAAAAILVLLTILLALNLVAVLLRDRLQRRM